MGHSKNLEDYLNGLIQTGDAVVATARTVRTSSITSNTFVDSSQFHEWLASSLSFLRRVFGSGHTHTTLFEKKCSKPLLVDVTKGVAILRAASTDLEQGFLTSLKTLVEAEVFSDFLEMADHLIENGYKDSAASLVGAVLEDGLRKVAVRNDVKVQSKDDLQSLNTKLADKAVYSRLTQKRVKVWTDVRNNADHGHFSEYSMEHVREMRNGVGALLDEFAR